MKLVTNEKKTSLLCFDASSKNRQYVHPRGKRCVYLYLDSDGKVFDVTNYRYFKECVSQLSQWASSPSVSHSSLAHRHSSLRLKKCQ